MGRLQKEDAMQVPWRMLRMLKKSEPSVPIWKKKLKRARGHVGRWHSGAYGRGSVDGKCEQLLAAGAAADRPQRAPDPMLEYESSRAG